MINKTYSLVAVLIVSCFSLFSTQERILLDEVAAVVKWEETAVFAKSDVERNNLFGQKTDLKEMIHSELVFQDALRHKITIDEEIIDKYLIEFTLDKI